MRSRVIGVALLCAAVLAACDAPTTSQSQRGERRGEFRAACGADIQTHCPNAQSRQERRECIAANKEKFSEGCKTYMAQNPWRGRRDQGSQDEPPPANP